MLMNIGEFPSFSLNLIPLMPLPHIYVCCCQASQSETERNYKNEMEKLRARILELQKQNEILHEEIQMVSVQKLGRTLCYLGILLTKLFWDYDMNL